MLKEIDYLHPELDEASLKFADDVRVIVDDYKDEGQPLIDDMQKTIAEHKRLIEIATEEYNRKACELNAKYKERVKQAAWLRKKKAKHPEDIDEAADLICRMFGGGGDYGGYVSAPSPDNAKNRLLKCESDRLRKEYESMRFSNVPLAPGSVF